MNTSVSADCFGLKALLGQALSTSGNYARRSACKTYVVVYSNFVVCQRKGVTNGVSELKIDVVLTVIGALQYCTITITNDVKDTLSRHVTSYACSLF